MKLFVRKDRLKFSAAHMTVFPDGSKEALHGHNYQVVFEADTTAKSLKEMVPFSEFKKSLQELCDAWDEKVLLAEDCPFFQIKAQNKTSLAFVLCKKEYLLPKEEVVLLPTDNVSSENLAQCFLNTFVESLSTKAKKNISSITIRIEESPGQGASDTWKAGKK